MNLLFPSDVVTFVKRFIIAEVLLFASSGFAASLAPTPPMGWNSYDAYHCAVTEKQFRAAVDFLAEKLLPYGYEYATIDQGWFSPGPDDWQPEPWKAFPIAQQWNPNGTYFPKMEVDAYGRFLPSPKRFPSAASGQGFRPLADYVHAKGMKFGIHIVRGIPRQAVSQKLPILGTNRIAGDVIHFTEFSWKNQTYEVDSRRSGAQEYYDSIFKLYAEWGVDLVKADNMTSPFYHLGEVEMMHKAIAKCGRPIILSLSWGPPPISRAFHVQQNATMWRISGDFWDRWPQVKSTFDQLAMWSPFAGPGHWPDGDMLPIGLLCIGGFPDGEQFPEHITQLTDDEIKTHMTLWCIARSPLIWGGDPIRTPEPYYHYLTNREILAMDQQGVNARQVKGGLARVWLSDIPNSDDKYLALFNLDDKPAEVRFELYWELLTGPFQVRDLWSGQNQEITDDGVVRTLASHASVALKLTRVPSQ